MRCGGWRRAEGSTPPVVADGRIVVLGKLLSAVEIGEDAEVSSEGTQRGGVHVVELLVGKIRTREVDHG